MELIYGGCFNCENSICNYRQSKCLRWKSGLYKVVTINGIKRTVKDCYIE